VKEGWLNPLVYYCLFDKETASFRPRQPKTALIQSADGVVPNRSLWCDNVIVRVVAKNISFSLIFSNSLSAVCSRTNEPHVSESQGVSDSIAMQAPHTRAMATWPPKTSALRFTSSPLARRSVSTVASARRPSLNEARGPRPEQFELDVEPRPVPPPPAALKDSLEEGLYIESRFVPHTMRACPWP
jgi:hypothetical protein